MCAHYQAPNGDQLDPADFAAIWDGRAEETREYVRPTNYAPILYYRGGERHLGFHRWGLIPFWAKPGAEKQFKLTFNARSETIDQLASFKAPFAKRRCLIPARGWYEWPEKRKSFISAANGGLLMLAGLWDVWEKDPARGAVFSYTMVMTEAAPELAWVHNRSPVVLTPEAQAVWMDPAADLADCKALLTRPPQEGEVRVEAVE